MARKNIKNKHKHKFATKIKSTYNEVKVPVLFLIVPISYLIIVILGAINQIQG